MIVITSFTLSTCHPGFITLFNLRHYIRFKLVVLLAAFCLLKIPFILWYALYVLGQLD